VSDLLDARDRRPDFSRQKELDDMVAETEKLITELLNNYEGKKNWPGVFREMHMNLARIWMRTGRHEDAMKQCDKVAEYNPVDADELREVIQEAISGKTHGSAQLDEVGIG